jgi:16S rRNA (cytosine967-C5)-methyltransferase
MSKSDGLPPRRAAYKALCRVILKGQSLEECSGVFKELSAQDHKFARALTLSTLRHYGALEHIVRQSSSTGKKIKPKELSIIACMGAAQLKLLEVPDHAAVDATLKLAAKEGFVRQKGFLNAVLRKIAKEPQKEVKTDANMTHIPDWMLQSWGKAYGAEELNNLLDALATEAPLDITCPDESKRKHLIATYGDAITPIGLHSLRFTGEHPNVVDIEGFKEGYWWVQDAASAYPVSALINLPALAEKGDTLKILDICAAPGGKTMQLAHTGAHVTALDISDKRLERLRENIKRTKLDKNVKIVQGDALSHQGSYDIILLDAPCTATGTLRRHPDAAFSKTKAQMDELIALQNDMLAHAYNLLSPNGYLLYCTCSLQKEEGENILNQFIKKEYSSHLLNISSPDILESNISETVDKNNFFRSLPHTPPLHGDGFFAALIQKK